MMHGDFDTGYYKSTFSKYLFGRGHKCMLLKMMTILDDPLADDVVV